MMSPRRVLKRYIRTSPALERLSDAQRERIAAKRLAKFSVSPKPHVHGHVTPEQEQVRDDARLRSVLKRLGRG
jgi:hypothetical protein